MEILTHFFIQQTANDFYDSLPINPAKSTKITHPANPQLAFQAQCGAAFAPAGPSTFKAFIEKKEIHTLYAASCACKQGRGEHKSQRFYLF